MLPPHPCAPWGRAPGSLGPVAGIAPTAGERRRWRLSLRRQEVGTRGMRGHGDRGTWGNRDVGTRGHGDTRTWRYRVHREPQGCWPGGTRVTSGAQFVLWTSAAGSCAKSPRSSTRPHFHCSPTGELHGSFQCRREVAPTAGSGVPMSPCPDVPLSLPLPCPRHSTDCRVRRFPSCSLLSAPLPSGPGSRFSFSPCFLPTFPLAMAALRSAQGLLGGRPPPLPPPPSPAAAVLGRVQGTGAAAVTAFQQDRCKGEISASSLKLRIWGRPFASIP